ncbi:malate synthase G [Gammaproteobacteria bacterium]|nr:malate synthase G [Gammaproteobacteria bacterium]MDC0569827.1 malate synthase G [Gammaproteobacteria bacterium]MDC3323317.1 malate synthase G [Gammaproteobacteria bacterium]|tara:strand:- start:8994 stop:11159 length:2166 start_codon:yes stop_codon:yes gene_type:complete
MSKRHIYGTIQVSAELDDFLRNEVVEGIDVDPDQFWKSFERILEDFSDRNKDLLNKRKDIQNQIDSWHLENNNSDHDHQAYVSFLKEIGYLLDEGEDFEITTQNVDDEIKTIAGAQLVVPVMNARFSLNAANARWGSLYDALYGTDMISEAGGAERSGPYNSLRGDKVIEFSKTFLDESVSLSTGSYKDVTGFKIQEGKLEVSMSDQSSNTLLDDSKYVGYCGDADNPSSILLKNNNLHIEIQIDHEDSIGKDDPAGIKDVVLESAVTTIQDLEDSVAAVDAEDKSLGYRNWLGLMKGDLKESFMKGGEELTRSLADDRIYKSSNDEEMTLPGRSVLLVRNVGHLMTNPAILDKNDNEVPEGIMDAMFTICIAKHDLLKQGNLANTRTGSIYIVKPKMHGPEEVQFTCDLFARVEEELGLDPLTVKIGIMDEERRTTVNLKECIRAAKDRIIFINTGFLDRTGDEIHTSMEAGPVIPKAQMKQQPWISAYEDWNVDIGLETGFKGRAQIGKGMWAMPDEMLGMYENKSMHPEAGANCAWVPSPTAATLHAIHYHQVLVSDQQARIVSRSRASLEDILSIPLLKDPDSLSPEDIQAELDNNCQGILGYVVRWVDFGVGCSKVPDINNVGLMEDRATCRISSQHIANWLHHDLCNKDQVIETMKKMAVVVDEQNQNDPDYKNMSPSFDGVAFSAAVDLAIEGRSQPSGYTEPILHSKRLQFKS